MGSVSSSLYSVVALFFLVSFSLLQISVEGCYTSIFGFGDSNTDTGNSMRIYPTPPPHFAFPPYGETFFHHPTGRCSNGRLIIDFIAQYFGIPLIQPYFRFENATAANFQQGVNFAVVGGTALDFDFFEQRGIHYHNSNYSLGVQLGLFKEVLSYVCDNPSDCKTFLRSSLFLMGEIGGNDFNHAFFDGKSVEETQSYVPFVINSISSAIDDLIKLGAVTFMVPGNFPIGCTPKLLKLFMTSTNKEDYDPETGCLIWLNEFSEYYNENLRIELDRMQELHPNVTIIYADYYNAAMRSFRSPKEFGFTSGTLAACCGGGGPYNVDDSIACGYPGSKACDDPSTFINWDDAHSTEAASKLIAERLLNGPFTTPPISTTCAPFAASS